MKLIKMKNIYILLISIVLFSCEENKIETENSIEGKWNVTETIGGFSKPKNYNAGDFTWEFNFVKKTVTIVNNVDIFTALDVPSFINNQGGVYSFEIIEENNSNFLVVGNRKGEIILDLNNLTLDYGIAVDDIGYIFIR
jgi:hypothetical protein